ncbi:MAG: aromatic ring-hydroxylating dioxygenase subunit alpha, partial [Proteobacteria bacterium]|nr:aromatic ring-hydroxylating dioxygenase subunit alpha [Pseudomonadota bacterium]
EFARLEMERLWTRVWQMACREEEIPDVGDHVVYDIDDTSFIIMRVAENDIRAFYNACLHRGTQLRASGTSGNVPQLRCPFHGFTWNLDGSLQEIPCDWDFPHIDKDNFDLPQAKLDTWDGFVFINMDPDCVPLSEYLGVLPDHFTRWPLKDRFMSANVRKILNCNWKVALEAFIESFHVIETHPQALPMTGDANTQYDIWGDNVSRLYTPQGIPSPHVKDPMTEEQMAEAVSGGVGATKREGEFKLKQGETARSIYAASLVEEMQARFGADVSKLTISELIDPIEYFLFPNFLPWFNFSLPLIYRFLPYGDDPDMSVMDVMLLHPIPDDGPRPDPSPLRVLGVDEPFTDAPELDQISPIFQQDVANMPRVQRGLKTLARNNGIVLGNYQEIRIRHMHQTLDKYLAK